MSEQGKGQDSDTYVDALDYWLGDQIVPRI